MGLWDRWFGPEGKKRRDARRRINGYFRDVDRAIKNGRSELTLTAVRSRQVVETAGARIHPLMPTSNVYTDVEADFEIRHERKHLVGSLHFYLGEMTDGYFCEGTFVNLEGVRLLGMEYGGVSVLMDAVEKRARAQLKAQQAEQSREQEQAELRVAGALPRR